MGSLQKVCATFAWATVGTGYGGYLFLNGKLYDGSHGFAGNFGHMTLDEINGYPCGCGRKGCFETFVADQELRALVSSAEQGPKPDFISLTKEGVVTSQIVISG